MSVLLDILYVKELTSLNVAECRSGSFESLRLTWTQAVIFG